MRLCVPTEKKNICGDRVRERRISAGWSQEQLATKLQLAGLQLGQMMVSRIERGLRIVPDYELPYFASVLGATINWLIGEKEASRRIR